MRCFIMFGTAVCVLFLFNFFSLGGGGGGARRRGGGASGRLFEAGLLITLGRALIRDGH